MTRFSLSSHFVIAVVVMICVCLTAGAADHTVTNNADSGNGTLRKIIETDAGGGESIDFEAGLDTIVLTSGDITIDKSLTIIGPAYDLAVSGNASSRIFDVNGNDITVLISDLIITNGLATGSGIDEYGGGIYLGEADNSVTISNCTIVGCTADEDGGGLYVNAGVTLTVRDSRVSGNTATDKGGGAYLFSGAYTLDTCRIYENESSQGGGLCIGDLNDPTTTGTIVNCVVSNNTTSSLGGGIYCNGDSNNLSMAGCTITVNTSGSYGGGMYVGASVTDASSTRVLVNGTTFSDNAATNSGGGIYVNDQVVYMTNCTISGNSSTAATFDGGGIAVSGGQASLEMDGCTMSGCSAADAGGGIYASDPVTIRNSTISGCSADGQGGALHMRADAPLTILSSTISGCTADDGGGMYALDLVTISNCTISGCTADDDAGGMYASDPVVICNSTFSGNDASGADGRGGAVYFNGDGDTLKIYNSTIYTNSCGAANRGGGIYRVNGDVYLYSAIIAGSENLDMRGEIHTLTNCCYQTESGIGTPEGSDNVVGDPELDALADNGGPTMTHALQSGSQCINEGVNILGLLTDQRGTGYARVTGGDCDIGAFEFGSGLPAGTIIIVK